MWVALLLTFFQQNISLYAIFNNQSFNDTLTNGIISFEQLGPGYLTISVPFIDRSGPIKGHISMFFSEWKLFITLIKITVSVYDTTKYFPSRKVSSIQVWLPAHFLHWCIGHSNVIWHVICDSMSFDLSL